MTVLPTKITFYPFLVVPKFYIQHFLLCDPGLEASESLQVLQLSFNKISTLQPEDLSSLRHLTELHLGHNLISSLHPQMFQNLTQLRVTIISESKNIHSPAPTHTHCVSVTPRKIPQQFEKIHSVLCFYFISDMYVNIYCLLIMCPL